MDSGPAQSNEASASNKNVEAQASLINTTTQQFGHQTPNGGDQTHSKRPRRARSIKSKVKVVTNDPELLDLTLQQWRDDKVIEGKLFDSVIQYRRKRSLKFREKMRAWRTKIFKDPLHRVDRSFKNANKVIAARRRQRDTFGKFNYEENQVKEEAGSKQESSVDSFAIGTSIVQSGNLFDVQKITLGIESMPNQLSMPVEEEPKSLMMTLSPLAAQNKSVCSWDLVFQQKWQ